jgi:hypothetical protein
MNHHSHRRQASVFWLVLMASAAACDTGQGCSGEIAARLSTTPSEPTSDMGAGGSGIAEAPHSDPVSRSRDTADEVPSSDAEPQGSTAARTPDPGFSVIYRNNAPPSVPEATSSPPAPTSSVPAASTQSDETPSGQVPAVPDDELIILPAGGSAPPRPTLAPKPPLNGGPAFESQPMPQRSGLPLFRGR